MTISGGVIITSIVLSDKFKKQYKKLPSELKETANKKIKDLLLSPMPHGLRFEKLKGYSKPDIYSIHVTGNYKITIEIKGNHAKLRRIANHKSIDKTP